MDDEGHAVDTGFLRELEEKIGMITKATEINLDEIIKAAGRGRMKDDSAEGAVTYSKLKFPEDFDGNYPQMFPFVMCCGITSVPREGDVLHYTDIYNGIPLEFPRYSVESVGKSQKVVSPDPGELSGGDSQEQGMGGRHDERGAEESDDALTPSKRTRSGGFRTPWHALSLLMDITHLLSVEDVVARRDARSSVGDALEVLVEQRQP
jgi:hypothetical protein